MHILQKALEYIRQHDYNCGEFFIQSYSGRGMYGRSCLAITGDDINPVMIGFAIGCWCADNDTMLDGGDMYKFSNMKQDNMGLGSVYYWPQIDFEASENDGYDEDDEDDE